MTNLFGRGKEPFWQQASTNLVKFVILLHQTLDDYVTLFQVYEHVINPDKLRAKIAEGERHFAREAPPHRRRQARAPVHDRADRPGPGTTTTTGDADVDASGRPISRTRSDRPASRGPRRARDAAAPRWADKVAQFEAVKRWFEDDWMRIEPKLRTSIVEGISVFLSLFDDNPRVKHTFCPPKDTYDPARESRRRRTARRCRRSPI